MRNSAAIYVLKNPLMEITNIISDAFYQMCMVLPSVIDNVVKNSYENIIPHDTVIKELRYITEQKDCHFVLAFIVYTASINPNCFILWENLIN